MSTSDDEQSPSDSASSGTYSNSSLVEESRRYFEKQDLDQLLDTASVSDTSSSPISSSSYDCESLLEATKQMCQEQQSEQYELSVTRDGDHSSSEDGSLSSHYPSGSSDGGSDVYQPSDRPPIRLNDSDRHISPVVSVPLSVYDLYRADPRVWSTGFQELPTLKAKNWMGGTLIDIWLLKFWFTNYRQTPFRYLPMPFIHAARDEDHSLKGKKLKKARAEVSKEIKRFRQLFDDLPQSENEKCPMENCLFVLNTRGIHYFTIVITPAEKRIHILGRDWTTNQSGKLGEKDWKKLRGPTILRRVCKLYGWSEEDMLGVTINRVDWKQNGYDCGPTACYIIEEIWRRGLHLDSNGRWKQPNLPCFHGYRLFMALEIYELLVKGYELFKHWKSVHKNQVENYLEGQIDSFQVMEDDIDELLRRDPRLQITELEMNLRSAILSCQYCTVVAYDKSVSPASPSSIPPEPALDMDVAHGNSSPRKSRHLFGGTRSRDEYVYNDGEEDVFNVSTQYLHKSTLETSDSERDDNPSQVAWTEATIGRYPRPKHGPSLPPLESLRGLRHAFSRTYDNYEDGPTLDVLDPIPETVMQFSQASLVYLVIKIVTTPWIHYKDYGYRLLPDFMQMFWLMIPILVREHLLPVGLEEPPGALPNDAPPERSRSGRPIHVNDRRVCGAAELLRLCDKMRSDIPLLTGKDENDSFIHVDLERDRIIPDAVRKACDIDSLIWITRQPQFSGSIVLNAVPVIRTKPPLWKNNHLMVDLLYPQSENDKATPGSRTEWQTKRFRLSQIPNLLFGQLNGTSVDLLLFFPRMTHQHPQTKRWVNSLPPDVQNFFWDTVLLPAVQSVLDKVQEPYITADRDHATFKGSKSIPHPFRKDKMNIIIEKMKEIIDKDSDRLSHFGSFFFAIQLKGSKGQSMSEDSTLKASLSNAIKLFKDSFPGLDWEYMMNRQNGELICDVGITIQPEHKFPLVGLWRLDCLEASYGAAGYLSGKIHTINTLALYGGLQAESSEERCKYTHVVFHSSYVLPYEAIRQRDNSRDFFKSKDVYQRNQKFTTQLKNIHSVYRNKANQTSYGVRDEYRVGAQVLDIMTECIDDMVEDFLDSRPILWLRSSTWFDFLDRRLSILSLTHWKLYEMQPRNYGVLSGLFAYLMQSVLFTPPIVDSYVRETLARLQYKRQVDSDGMFFLHTLDLERDPCILGISHKDNRTVVDLLGGPLPTRVPKMTRPLEEELGEDVYPLGATPTWSQIRRSLKLNPFQLMPRWHFPSELEDYRDSGQRTIREKAANLFVQLSEALWINLHPKWLRTSSEGRTEPVTLRTVTEALESWSVDFVCEQVVGYEFRPCNNGLKGVKGKKMPSFADRRRIYFPDENEAQSMPQRWKIFLEDTWYLGLYHQYARKLNTEDTRQLNRCLEELLSNCQCLPDSVLDEAKGNIWRSSGEHIILLANPVHYRIREVGNRKNGAGGRNVLKRAPAAQRPIQDTLVQMVMRTANVTEAEARRAIKMKKGQVRAEEKRKLARRSQKSKNARQPPKRKERITAREKAGEEERTQEVELDSSNDPYGEEGGEDDEEGGEDDEEGGEDDKEGDEDDEEDEDDEGGEDDEEGGEDDKEGDEDDEEDEDENSE